jgi:electron transfer flavoprotein alpha subunit
MLRQPLRIARTARLSSIAQRRLASSLVFLEHKGGKLNDSSLHAVTAAQKVDGEVSLAFRSLRAVQLTV